MNTLQQITSLSEFTQLYKTDPVKIIGTPTFQHIYQFYDIISSSMRDYLSKEAGFLEFKPPLLGPVTDPGTRGSKQVEVDYYGKEYKFMSSAILYKQLLSISRKEAGLPGKIYFFADNLRLEPLETASTDRHLVEFIQVDLELVDADHFDAMDVGEGLVRHVYRDLKSREFDLQKLWETFEPYYPERGLVSRSELKVPQTSFTKYTFKEAVDLLKEYISKTPSVLDDMQRMFGFKPHKLSDKTELYWEYEWLISSIHEEPFWIYDYPKGARGFYDREYGPEKKGLLMDFDLIMPHGYGEVISGAAREYQIERIIPRMKESGESLQKYEWYLQFLKKYGRPTAGFGIGLERTVRYFCGLPLVMFALPYPKVPGVFSL